MLATRTRILSTAAILLAAALYLKFALNSETNMLPRPFQAKSISKKIDNPAKLKELFTSPDYQNLSPDQKKQVAQDKANAYNQLWQDRIDTYFDAPESKREAILDAHIDRFAAQLTEPKKPAPSTTKNAAPKPTMTKQQRKEKSESASPDQWARTLAYKTAFTQRARARGISLDGQATKKTEP